MNAAIQQIKKSNWRRDLEREMRRMIAEGDIDAAVRFASEKALQSFNNGLSTGAKRVMQNAPLEGRTRS